MQSSVSLSEPPTGMCWTLRQCEPGTGFLGDDGEAEGVAGGEVGGGEWVGDEGWSVGLVEGGDEGKPEGVGVVGVEEPGFEGEAPPPLGTCWTVVSPPWLLGGTLTVTGLVEMPPSMKPCTGGGPLGSSRAQFRLGPS